MFAPSFSVEDGGTAAPSSLPSSLAATVAPDATSTAYGTTDDILKAPLTTFFVKLKKYFLINFGVLGAVANDRMLAFWGQRRMKGCWHFGGMGEDPMGGGRGFSFLINY